MSFDRNNYRRQVASMNEAKAEDVTMPSGAVFKLRRPQLAKWLVLGRTPKALVSALMSRDNKRQVGEITDADIVAMGTFTREIVLDAVVEPRIPDELPLEDLAAEDIEFIFQWASRQQEVAALETFRDGTRPLAPGADGENVRPAAQPAAGD